LRKTDKKKGPDDESTTFDATPGTDVDNDRLVIQLTLEDEANGGTSPDELETGETASDHAGAGLEDTDTDETMQNIASQAGSVSMVESSEVEDSSTDENTHAVTIAPAAVEAALDSMSDGSGDVG
jgi:hypothetical protein